MKQNDGFTDTLQSIREAVLQTAQNTSAAQAAVAQQTTANPNVHNNVPHLTHEPMPPAQQPQQQAHPTINQLSSPIQLQVIEKLS